MEKATKASQESTEYRPTNKNHEWLSQELLFRQASYKTEAYFHERINLDTRSILEIFTSLKNHSIHGMTAKLYVAALENNSEDFASLMGGLKKNPLAIARLRLAHPHLLYWDNGLVNYKKMAEECKTFSEVAAEAGHYGVAQKIFKHMIMSITKQQTDPDNLETLNNELCYLTFMIRETFKENSEYRYKDLRNSEEAETADQKFREKYDLEIDEGDADDSDEEQDATDRRDNRQLSARGASVFSESTWEFTKKDDAPRSRPSSP